MITLVHIAITLERLGAAACIVKRSATSIVSGKLLLTRWLFSTSYLISHNCVWCVLFSVYTMHCYVPIVPWYIIKSWKGSRYVEFMPALPANHTYIYYGSRPHSHRHYNIVLICINMYKLAWYIYDIDCVDVHLTSYMSHLTALN